ncbi:MAG: glycosyltransferase family 9 protein [Gammaproteobacteria bacterium]|nr:glycosyltransferase family 9 protein [Gammaproteobacteria bacterium]MDH3505767.1 glycosyltransferase family 9 protein [Gammaproteobacteria bacterium]
MSALIPLTEPPQAVCIIRLSAIGDTCHTVPVVRALQDAWPQTAITWIVGKVEHSLLEGLEGVEFIILDKTKGWAGYREVRRALRGRRFPLLLHMHASLRANIVSTLVSAKVRLGFDRARARDHQWLFTNKRLPPTPQQHVMNGLFEFADALGVPHGKPHWDIPLGDADREFAAEHVDGLRPTLMISPCTGQRFRNYRNWSVERYANVADYAAAHYGAQIVLTGGPTELEREYGERISANVFEPTTNLIGRTTLKQLLAIIERATVVLCPDSGPAHMATAVGTPVVGLYATSNRYRTGPWASQHLVVDRYPQAVAAEFHKRVEDLRWGERVRDPGAMDLIEVADVTRKLDVAFSQQNIAPRVEDLLARP